MNREWKVLATRPSHTKAKACRDAGFVTIIVAVVGGLFGWMPAAATVLASVVGVGLHLVGYWLHNRTGMR